MENKVLKAIIKEAKSNDEFVVAELNAIGEVIWVRKTDSIEEASRWYADDICDALGGMYQAYWNGSLVRKAFYDGREIGFFDLHSFFYI